MFNFIIDYVIFSFLFRISVKKPILSGISFRQEIKMRHRLNKSQWGIFLFCIAAVFVATAFCGFVQFERFFFGRKFFFITFSWVIPYSGLAFSAFAIFIGHFSYPRIHNLKVYLISYLVSLTGIFFFVMHSHPIYFHFPKTPEGYYTLLYFVIFINFIIVLLAPSYVKYKLTRQLTLSVFIFEALLLLLSRIMPQWGKLLAFLTIDSASNWLYWICLPWFTAVVLLSIKNLRHECCLGGVVAGCALFYFVSWHYQLASEAGRRFELLLFAIAPLYLEIGVLAHWFIRMEQRISYDPLLHIYNREYCSKIIAEQSNLNISAPCTVAMVDIDFFKKVNDTYGHQAGDHVLYTVAQTFSKEVIPYGVLCRYGGEELIIFFPQKTSKEILPLMESIRSTIEELKINFHKKRISVTVSIGICCREKQEQTIVETIKTADKALYRAKKGGRNRVRISKISTAVQK